MAAIATNTQPAGASNAFVPLFGAATNAARLSGPSGQFIALTNASILIRQRVWDTVNLVWCYYEDIVLNAAPLPAATSPVHSGSITSHQVVNSESV